MLTDKIQLITFLHSAEGGNRSPAYDDKQPWKVLEPGDEILGTLTYGPGFTTREDGSPLQIGDTITEQEAYARLSRYVDEEIEPVLENLIHVPIAPSMANALASLIFNFGATEVSGWRLWGRINAGEDPGAVIREWVNGTFFSKGEPMLGLWRRRTMELLLGFGLDWRAGSNVSWEDDPEDVMKQLGWDGTMPTAGPAHISSKIEYSYDEDLAALFDDDEVTIPEPKSRQVISDPTPETPETMNDKQYMGYVAAVGDGDAIPFADFMSHRTLVTEKNAIKAPKVDVKREPKAMEDSETANGFAKEVSGKDDVRLATVLSGTATSAAIASTASDNLANTMENTQTMIGGLTLMQLVWIGLIFGLPLLGYGLWKMHRGKLMKNDGRSGAVRAKV